MLTAIGYLLAVGMGGALGLLGGGGSILTLPILVYCFAIPATLATSYTLLTVGITSGLGASLAWKKQMIDWGAVGIFAPISALTVFVIRHYFLPLIPQTLQFGHWQLSTDSVVMILFIIVMFASAVSMIRSAQHNATETSSSITRLLLVATGVGIITGTIGAGGGFLFVPALTLLAGVPMQRAVGTSLTVITINALIGLTGDVLAGLHIAWMFALPFTAASVCGMALGSQWNNRASGTQLKHIFGWFTLSVGIFMLLHLFFTPIN